MKKSGRSTNVAIRLILTVGIWLVLPLALGVWLDYSLTPRPLATLLGAALGVIASTIIIVRKMSRAIEALAPSACDDRLDADTGREWEGG